MARFSYTARERTGELTEGTMEATDESAVVIEAFPTDEELMIAGHVQRVLLDQPMARRA